MGRFRYSWQRWRRWRASMGLFMLPAYKVPAGILAARAGCYGRKNGPGKNSRARFTLIFSITPPGSPAAAAI
jgi:hypothetical protein